MLEIKLKNWKENIIDRIFIHRINIDVNFWDEEKFDWKFTNFILISNSLPGITFSFYN